jgi:hypothetical protein
MDLKETWQEDVDCIHPAYSSSSSSSLFNDAFLATQTI